MVKKWSQCSSYYGQHVLLLWFLQWESGIQQLICDTGLTHLGKRRIVSGRRGIERLIFALLGGGLGKWGVSEKSKIGKVKLPPPNIVRLAMRNSCVILLIGQYLDDAQT